jgi:hypothetical protein
MAENAIIIAGCFCPLTTTEERRARRQDVGG